MGFFKNSHFIHGLVILGLSFLHVAQSLDPTIEPSLDENSTFTTSDILEEAENFEATTTVPEILLESDEDVEKLLKERQELKLTTNTSYADKKTKEKIQSFSNNTQANILKVLELERKYGQIAIVYGANESLDVFKYLLFDGGDIETYDLDGQTALHVAAINNNIEVIEFLTEKDDININIKDLIYKRTAINWAAFYNNLEIIQILAENPNTIINSKDGYGHNALHLASYKGNLNTVEWLVKNGNISVYSKDKTRSRPLDLAAYEGHLDVIKFLFENGAKINVRNKNNNTAIHKAAFKNRLDVLKFLIDNGGYINLKNKWGYSALHYATEKGFYDEVKYLVDNNKTKIHIKNNKGCTPLHVTTSPEIDFFQFLETVNELFESGIKKNDDPINNLLLGYLALIVGLMKKPDEMVFILDHYEEPDFKRSDRFVQEKRNLYEKYNTIENKLNLKKSASKQKTNSKYFSKLLGLEKLNLFKSSEQFQERNLDFETFQSEYVQNKSSNHVNIAKYLIENGNADINVRDKKGNTPIINSLLFENVTKYLLQSGADINSQNYKNNTLLHNLALEHEDLENPTYIHYVVLYNNTNVNLQNIRGNTPLHIAAKRGYFDFVKILYKNKNLNSKIKNIYGRTALHEAAAFGNENIVEWISERNNNVIKMTDNNGNTALHVAAENNKVDVVEWLIEEGDAEMSVRNNQGETPFKVAKIHSSDKVMEYFNDNYF